MWSYESARSQDARRLGRCAIAFKDFGPDLTLPIPIHQHQRQQQHHPVAQKKQQQQQQQQQQHQVQPLAHRSTRHDCQRDVEGIARLIQIFNSSITIDRTQEEPGPTHGDSSAPPNKSNDTFKMCSKCKGERLIRRAGLKGRRMLCKMCAVKHGRRPRVKGRSDDAK